MSKPKPTSAQELAPQATQASIVRLFSPLSVLAEDATPDIDPELQSATSLRPKQPRAQNLRPRAQSAKEV